MEICSVWIIKGQCSCCQVVAGRWVGAQVVAEGGTLVAQEAAEDLEGFLGPGGFQEVAGACLVAVDMEGGVPLLAG